MQEDLASIRGVVDLSPQEALDSAQDFLVEQGYGVTHRTATTLTMERQDPNTTAEQEGTLKLVVMALPQPEGGVQLKVSGNDREGVRERQAQWLEWSESLPKRETEEQRPEAAATTESVATEAVGPEGVRPTTEVEGTVPQARYCSNCGQPLDPDAQFCQSCGQPTHETARIRTPQAYVPTPPPPQPQQAPRDPGVWTGVKLGCGMFIVLPIIIGLIIIVFLVIVASGGQ
jgi:hypothetical protein